ncbi:hypothetical protein FKG94_09780 [Exilibacterium tricleocarpae]|uniref:Preprotein translocase subunit YajC n=1 Tax=Exilibacterium tricleocarpae TaxID=2591008 RepID=A0A545TVX0_9GAMM|nr:hypothetical protein [Exilibacterium tricleocarpae]TQV81370.1 hypothetical protein FKG94_09780 [Exilibacterium tricleocarpae]
MWIPVIIVALAVVMVVGPVMLMRPTNLQRRQSRLRAYAGGKGLRVRLQAVPEGAKSPDARQLLPVYILPATDAEAGTKPPPPWLLVRRSLSHEIHFSGHWDWQGDQRAAPCCWDGLRETLERLPADVIALGRGPQGVYVFWAEEGSEQSVDRLCDLLLQVSELPHRGNSPP